MSLMQHEKEVEYLEKVKAVQASELKKGDRFIHDGKWYYVTDDHINDFRGKVHIGCRPVIDMQKLIPCDAWVRVEVDE